MRKLRLMLGLAALASMALVGSTALGAGLGSGTCAGGTIAPGTYDGLTVTGTCSFGAGTIQVNGNLIVAPGASLNDHAVSTATVVVTGNVLIGRGAAVGLGTYNPRAAHDSSVGGNIIADAPLSLYFSFLHVHGNLVSNGGGGGVTGQFRNFPTKDNTIDGNLIIQGWTGGWIGVIRDYVGGNVIFSNNASVIDGTGITPVPGVADPDSSEIMTNVIGGNLICQGNTPAAQVNPGDGGQPNIVGGRKIGQCAGL